MRGRRSDFAGGTGAWSGSAGGGGVCAVGRESRGVARRWDGAVSGGESAHCVGAGKRGEWICDEGDFVDDAAAEQWGFFADCGGGSDFSDLRGERSGLSG